LPLDESEKPTCINAGKFVPTVWWSYCGYECSSKYVRCNKEDETGGTALHNKLRRGGTCTAVMPYNIHRVGEQTRTDRLIKPDELSSILSTGKVGVMTITELFDCSEVCAG